MRYEKKLKDLTLKIGSGATPRGGQSSYLKSGEIHLLRSQNIYNHQFIWNGIAYISEEQANKLKNVIVEKDDILINITGDSIARNMIANDSFLPARVNQHVSIIRCNREKLDPYYLSAVLTSKDMQKQLLSLGQTGGTRAALTKGMIENLEIPMYPLKTQQLIGEKLKILNKKIALNNSIITNLEELAQTLFKRWFVDFEFPNEEGKPYKSSGGKMVESELGMIPEGWEHDVLKNITLNLDRKRVPLSKLEREKREKIYPYYGAASLMDYVDDYIFEGIHVLIGEDGTVIDDNGYPILQYVWDKFWVNNHAHVLQGKDEFSEEYIYLLLKKTNVTNIVTGAVQPKINQTNLNKIKIIRPDKQTLNKFDEVINPIFTKIRKLHDENSNLTNLRDTLLPKLLSGEIELPDDVEVTDDVSIS